MNRIATAVMDGAETGATGVGVILPLALIAVGFFAFKALREYAYGARSKQIKMLQDELLVARNQRDSAMSELAAISRVLDDAGVRQFEGHKTMSIARRVRVALEKTS